MAKDINLASKQWNDIVFEDRPKDYGAYDIRLSSSKRHIVAFVFIIFIMAFVAMLPKLAETVANLRPPVENISDDTTLADLELLEEIEKQEEIIQQTIVEPPPPLKSTIQFVPPEIVADEEIEDEDLLKSQEELQESTAQVSLFDVEGTDEELGVDLATLQEHQEVAGVVDETIHDFVDQQAQFPGGLTELNRWLEDNLKYPAIASENGISGTVTLQFAVMVDGTTGMFVELASPDKSLTDEAIRAVKAMPKWIPGMLNGKAVNSTFRLPVKFQMNQ
jgi:protein TonB